MRLGQTGRVLTVDDGVERNRNRLVVQLEHTARLGVEREERKVESVLGLEERLAVRTVEIGRRHERTAHGHQSEHRPDGRIGTTHQIRMGQTVQRYQLATNVNALQSRSQNELSIGDSNGIIFHLLCCSEINADREIYKMNAVLSGLCG